MGNPTSGKIGHQGGAPGLWLGPSAGSLRQSFGWGEAHGRQLSSSGLPRTGNLPWVQKFFGRTKKWKVNGSGSPKNRTSPKRGQHVLTRRDPLCSSEDEVEELIARGLDPRTGQARKGGNW